MPLIAKPTGILDANLLTVEKFASKFRIDQSGCWVWIGYKSPLGYGRFTVNRVSRSAHRVMWELAGRTVDFTKQLDHLCRNTSCINPAHLEQVTGKVNTLRGDTVTATNLKKTHCTKKGHPLSGDNLYLKPRDGGTRFERVCVECNRTLNREFYRANYMKSTNSNLKPQETE